MSSYEHVLSAFSFGGITVKNRIESAPTGYMLGNADGIPTLETLKFYESIAKGGAGIVTIGETAIDYDYANNFKPAINLGSDAVIPGLFKINEAVSQYGAKLSIELQHSGSHVPVREVTIGPSPIPYGGELGKNKCCLGMDREMIETVINNFASAAQRCQKAGLEMIMVHGGHGHLLAQFVSPHYNKRTDEYGGSLENRARFPMRVLDAIRQKAPGLAIEYRISANEFIEDGMSPDDTIEFVRMIEDKIDLLHVSVGINTDASTRHRMIQPTYLPHCTNVHYAEKLKKALKVPITTVGSIATMEEAEEIIASGKADIVAMGRAIMADHEIVNNARHDRAEKTRPCLRCCNCNKYTGSYLPIRCAVNPQLGREMFYDEIKPAVETRKLVIAGGGPGGMEAALTAAKRGIKVVLYEKEDKLGGNLKLASSLDIKSDMRRYLSWLIKTVYETPGITVKTGTMATPENIRAEKPDALIIAVGSTPILPHISGQENNNIIWVGDAHASDENIGDDVLIVGAGLTGVETSISLSRKGKKVTVVDMMTENAVKSGWTLGVDNVVTECNVNLIFESKLVEVNEIGAVIERKDGSREVIPSKTIILSLGFRPRVDTVKTLRGIVVDTYEIGDCKKTGMSMQAIHDGFNVAMQLR